MGSRVDMEALSGGQITAFVKKIPNIKNFLKVSPRATSA